MPALPGEDRPVVPVAAIYGANASGKSNLLDGLNFMRYAALGSLGTPDAFRLGDVSAVATYVVELVTGGTRYTYGFVVDGEAVAEEWLFAYPGKRRRVIFERDRGRLKLGSTVSELKSKLAVLEELLRQDTLLISMCDRLDLGPLMPVFSWFANTLQPLTVGADEPVDALGHRVGRFLHRNPQKTQPLRGLLAAADTGVTDVLVEEVEGPVPGSDHYLRRIRAAAPGEAKSFSHFKIVLGHGGDGVPFDLRQESAGTQSWLGLLPTVLTALESGNVLVVDEIDTSLHPMLTAKLVGLFQNEETNPRRAQLIFTTHDTSLLGTMLGGEVLERDQIWFVDKNADGASSLYPLTDFKPRKDQNTERRYLVGSYGAVPVLGDFAQAVQGR